MKYILKDGYIDEISFGATIECKNQTCTEYTGAIPAGYTSLEEWVVGEEGKLNAWKIAEGNLVFDNVKYASLQAKYEQESKDNRLVVYKEISNINNIIKKDSAENYLRSTSISAKVGEIIDSNKFASTYIKLVANENITDSVAIKFNNGNLLTNDATSKKVSGINFKVNTDRSIKVSGTATANIEYSVAGSSTDTKPILALKKDLGYYLSGLNGITLKMYNYDGTNRTEIYSGTGGAISFTDSDKTVTQIVLSIANATKISSKTVKPMLNLGETANPYVAYEGNEVTVNLGENTFHTGDNIKIEDGSVILQNEIYIGNNLIIGNDLIIGGNLINLDSCIMPLTYLDKTYMYTYKDTNLIVEYPNTKKNVDLTGYETPNGGFGVDEEGNMYCNNATITGGDMKLYDYEHDLAKFTVDGHDTRAVAWSNAFGINAIEDDYEYEVASLAGNIVNGETVASLSLRGTDLDNNIYATTENDEDGSPYLIVRKSVTDRTLINGVGVWASAYNNVSLESTKKNFAKLNNALNIIKDTDIYSYNLKSQNDNDKKHIGLVIGENFKYSKALTNEKNNAVDLYAMVSVCFKAIQEQQKQIEILENKIKEMESGN